MVALAVGLSVGLALRRFESLILSHNSWLTCECNEEEINDDDDAAADGQLLMVKQDEPWQVVALAVGLSVGLALNTVVLSGQPGYEPSFVVLSG